MRSLGELRIILDDLLKQKRRLKWKRQLTFIPLEVINEEEILLNKLIWQTRRDIMGKKIEQEKNNEIKDYMQKLEYVAIKLKNQEYSYADIQTLQNEIHELNEEKRKIWDRTDTYFEYHDDPEKEKIPEDKDPVFQLLRKNYAETLRLLRYVNMLIRKKEKILKSLLPTPPTKKQRLALRL